MIPVDFKQRELPQWEESSYYRVVVKLFSTNVPHDAVLYTGFLNHEGKPGAYSWVMGPDYDNSIPAWDNKKLEILYAEKLFTEGKLDL